MATPQDKLPDPKYLEDFYVKTAEFPAGFMTEYQPSLITAGTEHQDLAAGYPVGKRFKSARVMRVCDATRCTRSPGHRGRPLAHPRLRGPRRGRRGIGDVALRRVAAERSQVPAGCLSPRGDDDATLFDVDVTYQQQYTDMDVTQVPRVFRPQIGPLELNYWERVYATLPDEDIYEERQISRDGAVVVVRPDHYVAAVLPLDATGELASFFEGVLTKK
nr:hypothetical protein [Kocuria atrinae]